MIDPESVLTIPAEADAALPASLREERTALRGERVREVLPALFSTD